MADPLAADGGGEAEARGRTYRGGSMAADFSEDNTIKGMAIQAPRGNLTRRKKARRPGALAFFKQGQDGNGLSEKTKSRTSLKTHR